MCYSEYFCLFMGYGKAKFVSHWQSSKEQPSVFLTASLAVARGVIGHLSFRVTSKIWTWLFLILNYLSKAQLCWSLCCFGRVGQAPKWQEKMLPSPSLGSRAGGGYICEQSPVFIKLNHFISVGKRQLSKSGIGVPGQNTTGLILENLFHWMNVLAPMEKFPSVFSVDTFDSSCESSLTSTDISPQENNFVWPQTDHRDCFWEAVSVPRPLLPFKAELFIGRQSKSSIFFFLISLILMK